jgi:hypothetical protein
MVEQDTNNKTKLIKEHKLQKLMNMIEMKI